MSTDAVHEALVGIEAAFVAARKRRVEVARAIATEAPDAKALVEALLRREAADADADATPAARAAAALREARAAAEASRDASPRVAALLAHGEGTWDWALDEADARVAPLAGDVGEAARAYVAALRTLRTAFAALDDDAVQQAVTGVEAASARLEALLAR